MAKRREPGLEVVLLRSRIVELTRDNGHYVVRELELGIEVMSKQVESSERKRA